MRQTNPEGPIYSGYDTEDSAVPSTRSVSPRLTPTPAEASCFFLLPARAQEEAVPPFTVPPL